ncbi:MAG: acetyl-CoA C-acyltransferase [Pseudomonadota bacterium]
MTYLYDAVRTPRGRGHATDAPAPGGLSHLAPHELVRQLVDALLVRSPSLNAEQVGMLLLSCVGQVDSQGGHIALVSKLAAALPDRCAATTLNNYCAGGLTAINLGSAWAHTAAEQLVLAGGVEMLSQVPFLADQAHLYTKPEVRDALGWMPAPLGSEIVGALDGFTRKDLDNVTLRSHQRAAAAWAQGHFDRAIVPIKNADGSVALAKDEWVRPNLTLEKLATLPSLFADDETSAITKAAITHHFPDVGNIQFTHTAGHVPGFTDGAALAMIGSRAAGERAGLRPRAQIVANAEVGGDSILQFGAGFDAMECAMRDADMSLDDLDLIEFMEAFAAPPLRFERRYQPDMDRVNVNGGHLAMGHPMGATGAVLLSVLIDELERRDKETGMVVTLGATGVGSALIIRRVDH